MVSKEKIGHHNPSQSSCYEQPDNKSINPGVCKQGIFNANPNKSVMPAADKMNDSSISSPEHYRNEMR